MLDRLAAVECPAFPHRRAEREGGDQGPTPIVLGRGEGCYVFDVDGKRYLDLAAGFGSLLLGHRHPAIDAALRAQSERLTQGLGDVYASDTKVALLEALAAMHPASDARVLIAQSGGDAVTAAMKTASLATGRSCFIAFDGAYHGLGYAPLAACGFSGDFRAPFVEQLSSGIRFAPFPGVRGATARASLGMVDDLCDDSVAAVIVEPVVGRGGCVVPPAGWLSELAELCRKRGVLLVADEIWTGLGRTGALLRSRADGCEPDILCLGKGLGGGLSISACIGSGAVMSGWKHAHTVHTSTHAGAPLPCATALATLATIEREGLVERAHTVGEEAIRRLGTLLDGKAVVRGRGLMIGIELESAAAAQRMMSRLLERGFVVVTGGVDGRALTITPPLTIELDALIAFGQAVADELGVE
jgi:4-aminobutyrate aminotransferase/(S)-3-amino-2-methylpropionate transaminase